MDKQNGVVNDGASSNAEVVVKITLENCLIPKEKLDCSPSFSDGLDTNSEEELRIFACELVQTAGILLKLPQVAMATGQVLFQRFYYSKSFVRHALDVTAMGCVCLASKIEEAPRRIRDVINVFHHIRQVQCQKRIEPLLLDQQYIALKTQVIKAERRILKELGFCVHVKHPHKLITMYLQLLGLDKKPGLLQIAWNYMNDALRTNVFVQFPPETVACSCIFLSSRKLRLTLPESPQFFELFNMKECDIKDIGKRIMRLYKKPEITSQVDKLEKLVNDLRSKLDNEREKGKVIQRSQENTPNGAKSRSPTPLTAEKNRLKRSRSKSKSRSPSRTRSRSVSKSRSGTGSRSHDSYESLRHKRSKKIREYTPDHKGRKSYKNRRPSYTPSPPSKENYNKKSRSKHGKDYRQRNYSSDEEHRKRTSHYSYWKKYYSRAKV